MYLLVLLSISIFIVLGISFNTNLKLSIYIRNLKVKGLTSFEAHCYLNRNKKTLGGSGVQMGILGPLACPQE